MAEEKCARCSRIDLFECNAAMKAISVSRLYAAIRFCSLHFNNKMIFFHCDKYDSELITFDKK